MRPWPPAPFPAARLVHHTASGPCPVRAPPYGCRRAPWPQHGPLLLALSIVLGEDPRGVVRGQSHDTQRCPLMCVVVPRRDNLPTTASTARQQICPPRISPRKGLKGPLTPCCRVGFLEIPGKLPRNFPEVSEEFPGSSPETSLEVPFSRLEFLGTPGELPRNSPNCATAFF